MEMLSYGFMLFGIKSILLELNLDRRYQVCTVYVALRWWLARQSLKSPGVLLTKLTPEIASFAVLIECCYVTAYVYAPMVACDQYIKLWSSHSAHTAPTRTRVLWFVCYET